MASILRNMEASLVIGLQTIAVHAAQLILSRITNVEFILVLAGTSTSPIKDVYQRERENMEGGFKAIYDYAVRMADH